MSRIVEFNRKDRNGLAHEVNKNKGRKTRKKKDPAKMKINIK